MCMLCLQGKVSQYVFVSSAGAYKADSIEPMHVEGDARKSSAGEQTYASRNQHHLFS